MSNVHFIEPQAEFPCTNCGSAGSEIRQGRYKCNECGFLYNAKDSAAAKEAGRIPDGPPQIDGQQGEEELKLKTIEQQKSKHSVFKAASSPRSPKFVLLSKDRSRAQFVTQKTLKSELLRWEYEGINYDVFELHPKKISTKIEIE